MKTNQRGVLCAVALGLRLAWPGFVSAQAPDAPPANPPAADNKSIFKAAPAGGDAARPDVAGQVQIPPSTPRAGELAPGEKGLRLNFRGAPLETVLTYLSDAAGFIIVLETDVKGKVDVFSAQPLDKDEAVDLLNTVLSKNGYAAVRNGRTLRIVSRDDAKTKDIPVRSGSDPDAIPKSEEMVTQIIPVKYVNAGQLIQNLQQLLPTYATLTANESGNALVLTGTQTDVRRMVEIVRALDTSMSSASQIRVYALNYADAKELANSVKELFQPASTQNNNNNNRGQGFNPFQPGGGANFGGGQFGAGGGFGNRGGGNNAGGGNRAAATGNPVAAHVVAVADERSNSLIVSAPEDAMETINRLVKEIDVMVSDVTELRVFHLVNADPVEMAEIFANLFPDDTKASNTGNNQGFQFNRGGFFGGNRGGAGNANANATDSTRNKKKGRVAAVADPRTSSIIISADRDLMGEISAMIEKLDASPAKKQRVFVYNVENADVQQLEQLLQGMFQKTTSSAMNRNTRNQTSVLMNRSQNNSQGSATTSGSSSGFGGASRGLGGGGTGGGQFSQ